MPKNTSQKTIVIVGAGFAGLNAYLKLQRCRRKLKGARILFINKTESFVFTPLIHEIVSKTLPESAVTFPISHMPKQNCCQFLQSTASEIELDSQYVYTQNENGPAKIAYDYLILASGSKTNFYSVEGAQQFTMTLKTTNDAKDIKSKIEILLQSALKEKDPEARKKLLRFIVVGGGPTGIELAAEIREYLNRLHKTEFVQLQKFTEVLLVNNSDRLLTSMDPWFDKKTTKILQNLRVKILSNSEVKKVTAEGVELSAGENIDSQTVIWTAGVQANIPKLISVLKPERDPGQNRIKVNEFLQIPEYKNVFVCGDAAWLRDKETGQPYPMRAQFASRQGRLAAQNIAQIFQNKPLKEFFWKDKGFLVSLGYWEAVAEVMGIKFSGKFAWWLYRTAYLFNMVGWGTKFSTAWHWTVQLFTARNRY